jgi:hypothetical protein
MHKDLLFLQTALFDQCGFDHGEALKESESAEYGAYIIQLNHLAIRFRAAKITPTKIGQFVTLWKRNENGPIQPFDTLDRLDFCIISVRQNEHFGYFIFPKSLLVSQGVFSVNGKGGKRAIRVYPPWDIATNKQAQKTQKWQVVYFLDAKDIRLENVGNLKQLFQVK